MVTPGSNDITIAVTVYDRRTYLRQAITSALCQAPGSDHQVIVVEDCGPDPSLEKAITGEFGERIRYYRNKTRRGIFGNWNACIEACSTPWLCILHDDDFLEPTLVEAMIEVEKAAPGRGLYYGACHVVNAEGLRVETRETPESFQWHELSLESWARHDPVCFPGQLFNVAAARALGGFRSGSHYCADWEMWFRLALSYGAVATNRIVANYREHHTLGRGTTRVDVSGRKYALVNAQRKRHYAWLRQVRPEARFDRNFLQQESPMPTRFILAHGHGFSPGMLRYNAGLLSRSSAPNIGYRLLQILVAILSWRSLRFASYCYRLITP
ncbi:MAG: glycosyltransferase family 2 protein [Chthoniobacterales bacterium]